MIRKLLNRASAAFERVDSGSRDRGYSTRDCLMSGLAIFWLKYPSMLAFDASSHQNPMVMANLRRLFGIEHAPTDSTLRRRLDDVDPKHVHRALRTSVGWARRHRLLDAFRASRFNDRIPVLIDGTGFVTSTKVHCDHCLERKTRDGATRYSHAMLAAVVAHPDVPQVVPLAAEPIVKADGTTKQDCEQNAFDRLLPRLSRERQGLPLIVIADALYATAPVVKTLAEHDHRYILVLKDDRHKHALAHLDGVPYERAPRADDAMLFRWRQRVPLNKSAGSDCLMTVVEQVVCKDDGTESRWTWATDLPVASATAAWEIAKLGRRRWAIENETFKTLKAADGYHFGHNYGHGGKHLCTIMMLLMFLAFLYDQLAALGCAFFQAARAANGAMRALWEAQRAMLRWVKIASWEAFYDRLMPTWPQAP